MNNKGFAVSGIVYSILILFFLLIFGVLGVMGSRKIILDKMKNEIINELNNEVSNDVYTDDSGANYPRLANQMIPVVYDEEQNSWIYADIYKKWYDYDEKMWANAMVLKEGVTKTVGQKITEDEIALMYVWIPRFKYVMFNANNETVGEQQIEVIFENNTNATGTVKCIDALNQKDEEGKLVSEICTDTSNLNIINNISTYTHPAFTFGDEEIEGFWVGKFENSTTNSECLTNSSVDNCNNSNHIIEIKANSDSLRYINLANMFTSIQNISNNYGINDADSHMIKNMEWGAVTYLTQSKYGRCTNGVCEEITRNNVLKNEVTYNTQTGCAANEISETVSTSCQNEYNTTKGIKASTTGNIYGVYDMSGGAWEYTMSIMNKDDITSIFLENVLDKYYNIYSYGYDYSTYSKGRFGDSTKEIIKDFENLYGGWYDSHISMNNTNYPIIVRGGGVTSNIDSKIFYFLGVNYDSYFDRSSRAILIKK